MNRKKGRTPDIHEEDTKPGFLFGALMVFLFIYVVIRMVLTEGAVLAWCQFKKIFGIRTLQEE